MEFGFGRSGYVFTVSLTEQDEGDLHFITKEETEEDYSSLTKPSA